MARKNSTLSVAMITLNAERHLRDCLEAASEIADEIVIVDSGSTDATRTIAQAFKARFVFREWAGFGPQKNFAIGECSSDWVLVLDADEILLPELRGAIRKRIDGEESTDGEGPQLFRIKRKMWCFGRQLRISDQTVRLFRKGLARYDDRLVHEELQFDPRQHVAALPGWVEHRTYDNLSEYLQKFDRYTSLGADQLRRRGIQTSVLGAISHGVFRFVRLLFLKRLFLDGAAGLQYAILGGFYAYMKYAKLLEEERR